MRTTLFGCYGGASGVCRDGGIYVTSQAKQLSSGAECRPSSPADSPASPTALQASVSRLVTSVTSGENSPELFAKLGRDGSWVKTSQGSVQVSLDGSLEEFCETWPKWGILSDGVAGKLPTPERRTTGNGSSLWPTPTASDHHSPNCGRHHIDRVGMQSLRLNHYCFLLGRPDLAKSPVFREWLMGFPPGWTDLEHLATRSFRSRRIRSSRRLRRSRRGR